jgi:MFS family permease
VLSERDMRRNFLAVLTDAAGWGLGMGLISAATFLPLFVRQLSDSTLAVGLIAASMTAGIYLPGIVVARYVERLASVKRFVVTLAVIERGILFLIVPLIYLVGPHSRPALLAGFLTCWFLMNLMAGCNHPSYYKLVARTIPAGVRGRLYGVGGALAGILGIAAGQITGRLLNHLGYPHGYALCFTAAVVVLGVTVVPLAFMKEPPSGTCAVRDGAADAAVQRATCNVQPEDSPNVARCTSHVARERSERTARRELALGRVLWSDGNLMRLTLSHILFSGSLMAAGFYTEYAIRRFGAGPLTVGNFTSAVAASQVLASLLCGTLGDRLGNKWALQLATAAGAAAALLAASAGALWVFYPVLALTQIAATGWSIAAFNCVLEMGGEERTATYTALSTALTGPFKAAMPILGALLIPIIGYIPVFLLAAALTAAGLLVLTRGVEEPRKGSSRLPAPGSQLRPRAGGWPLRVRAAAILSREPGAGSREPGAKRP